MFSRFQLSFSKLLLVKYHPIGHYTNVIFPTAIAHITYVLEIEISPTFSQNDFQKYFVLYAANTKSCSLRFPTKCCVSYKLLWVFRLNNEKKDFFFNWLDFKKILLLIQVRESENKTTINLIFFEIFFEKKISFDILVNGKVTQSIVFIVLRFFNEKLLKF